MNILEYNREAWNNNVRRGNRWTQPVTSEQVDQARAGQWDIVLTSVKPVPKAWFPSLAGAQVLCLASGGGQQGPILAAAGAQVTVYDYSDAQLEQDTMVADRDRVPLRTVQGDMANLQAFADETFDLIVHPVSNVFVPDVRPVWREASRVLKTGGVLLAGFVNPAAYLFDLDAEERGQFEVRHRIPYADSRDLPKERLERHIREHIPMEFGHTLEDQLQGQMASGLVLTAMYEDTFGGDHLIDPYLPALMATRAVKMRL